MEKALFEFIAIVATDSTRITASDIRAVRAAGWSDAAIYDAITVCSLFRFFNTWVDASGVTTLTPEGYAESGQRLATCGYLMAEPEMAR
jgi:hypothetical protein